MTAVAVALVVAVAPRPAAAQTSGDVGVTIAPAFFHYTRRGSGGLPGVRLGRGRLGPPAGARGLPAKHARGREVARGQRGGGVAVPGAKRLPCWTRPRARADWSHQVLEFLLQSPEFGGLRDRRPWPPRWKRIPTTSARAARREPPGSPDSRAAVSVGESRGRRSPSRTNVARLCPWPHAPRSPRCAASR